MVEDTFCAGDSSDLVTEGDRSEAESRIAPKAQNKNKANMKKPREYCTDPSQPLAREYHMGNIYEQVTEPNHAPSLYQMVTTATVGSMPGNSPAYSYPDLEDDDELAHEHPDYEKLNKLDPVEKQMYVNEWLENPKNYEKAKETASPTDSTPRDSDGTEGDKGASNEQ